MTNPEKVLEEGRKALAAMYVDPPDPVGKVVRVNWRDPRGSGGSWMLAIEVQAIPPSNCITWGRCISLTEDFIVIASSVSCGDKYGPELVGDVMTVPLELVDEVVVLKKG